MLERFLVWLVGWLNGGRVRIPSGIVLLADRNTTSERRWK